jgi:hypothetical protein
MMLKESLPRLSVIMMTMSSASHSPDGGAVGRHTLPGAESLKPCGG